MKQYEITGFDGLEIEAAHDTAKTDEEAATKIRAMAERLIERWDKFSIEVEATETE